VEETLTRRALGLLIPRPNEDFDDAIADDVLATGREIAGALQGRRRAPAQHARRKAVVISRRIRSGTATKSWARGRRGKHQSHPLGAQLALERLLS